MSESRLRFQTPAHSPLSIKIFCQEESFSQNAQHFNQYKNNLEQLLNHPMAGFQHLNELDQYIHDCHQLKKQFSHKTHLVHIGMGGSILAAEVLLCALGDQSSPLTFLNNLDADDIHLKLKNLNLSQCLFYAVSKSGNTLETHIMVDIVISYLCKIPAHKNKTKHELLKEHFVFATDPDLGPLRQMAKDHSIACLDIPSHLGGRFCAFSVVTFLPALFLSINLQEFCEGAKKVKNFFMYQDYFKTLLQIAIIFFNDHQKNKKQTVLMPYSSRLKSFTHWFAQLWAESLGKDHQGLTPIVAHGPADQHSLLQLFVDGPLDKDFIFLKVSQTSHQFSHLTGEWQNHKSLSDIVHALLS